MTIKPGKTFLLYSRFKKGLNANWIYCGIVSVGGRKYRLLFSLKFRSFKLAEDDWISRNKDRIVWKEEFPELAKKHKERFEAYTEKWKAEILKKHTPQKDRERLGIK